MANDMGKKRSLLSDHVRSNRRPRNQVERMIDNLPEDNGFSDRTGIKQHEGKKYLRRIYSAVEKGQSIEIDVYCVLKAFDKPEGPIAHAIKKLLCAGKRNKGDKKADLIGVLAAVNRAIDQLEEGEIDPPNLEDDGDG